LKAVASPARPNVVRFGIYEFESHAKELRKGGMRVRLEGQPLAILKMLLDRPGELVTREELQKELWPADTFVDFEHSLNAAVKRLRAALNDSAEHPRYIETLSRRGYRFIAPMNGTAAGGEAYPSLQHHRRRRHQQAFMAGDYGLKPCWRWSRLPLSAGAGANGGILWQPLLLR